MYGKFDLARELPRLLDLVVIEVIYEAERDSESMDGFVPQEQIIKGIRKILNDESVVLGSGENKLAPSTFYNCLEVLCYSGGSTIPFLEKRIHSNKKAEYRLLKENMGRLAVVLASYSKLFLQIGNLLHYTSEDLGGKNGPI